jgi:hypothetical protein
MSKSISKSIEIALSLFPETYSQKQGYRTFHFACGWKTNELLAIGQNYPDKPSGKALRFARMFKTPKTITYPYLHAEIDLISRLWGKIHIDNNIKVVVVRLNKTGQLQNSKPCKSCGDVLNALNVENVWWSTNEGMTDGKILC